MVVQRVMLVGLIVLVTSCGRIEEPQPTAEAPDLDSIVQSAIAAHQGGEYQRSLELSLQAEAVLPGHPRLLFNTACAMALNGDPGGALDRLERIVGMEFAVDLDSSPSMQALRGEPRFDEVRRAMVQISAPLEKSTVAITVTDPTFLVEGVAHDPTSGDLFVSSLYQRRIARVAPEGGMIPFTEPDDDLWSMLGMVVDPDGGHLWSITVASPRMQNAATDEPLRSALVRFSLDQGVETARYPAPTDLPGSALDSLALGHDGTVYVSDSGAGAIHRLYFGSDSLEIMVPPETFLSTQGLELSADGKILYAADYGRGVAAIDLDSNNVRFMDHEGPCLLGIDGLERHGDDLIAIQNGIQPPRVVRIVLGSGGRSIERVEVLERAHHLYREPTLGTVVGDDLIYVAASQWRSFDADGKLLVDQLVEPTILRLPLND